ncbi:MAG TPA: hypothetical protein VH331_04230 [Allosphingosinicella sp.]|jgi:hypothetical protein|nr:hypothetical protein [Allosphingosinicella sp.]
MRAIAYAFAVQAGTVGSAGLAADGPRTAFACTLSNSKRVLVLTEADRITYRYGTAQRTELMIEGTPGSRSVFVGHGRFAGAEMQLRFVRGAYSYIIYTMEANGRAGSSAISRLMVMRGTRAILDLPCKPYADFVGGFDLIDRLPPDDDRFNAISGGD